MSSLRVRALLVALLLLAPLAGEAALRGTGPARLGLAALGYLVACLLFAWLAPPVSQAVSAECWKARRIWVALGLAAAIVGFAIAWQTPTAWFLAPIWLGGVACWLIGWRPIVPRVSLSARAVAPLALLLFVSAVMRLYDLPQLQPIQIDEMVMTEGSLRRGTDEPFGPRGLPLFAVQASDGFSQLRETEYRRLAVFVVGGINMLALRLPSVWLGLIEIAAVFLIGRELFSRRVGLVAAALLATSTAHLNFSRHGSIYIEGSIVWTLAAVCLARGLARRSAAWLALAGLALAWALYAYMSSRPSLLFAVALMGAALLDGQVRGRWLVRGVLCLLAGFAVGAGPMLAAYVKDPSIFAYRSNVTSWFGLSISAFLASRDVAALLPIWDHLRVALLGYNLVGSNDNHYLPGRGLFLWMPAALLFAGLTYATLRPLRWRFAFLALWFWDVTLGLSMLSEATPPGHRILPVVPAICLIAAFAFDRLLVSWERIGGLVSRVVASAAVLALGGSMLMEAWFYFGDYALRDYDRWQNHIVRMVAAAPDRHHVALVPGPSPLGMELYAGGKPFQWASNLWRRVTGEDLHRPIDQLPDLGDRPNGVTYMVHSQFPWWADLLRVVYPGGQASELLSADTTLADRLAWRVHTVPAAELARHRGLQLTATDSAGRAIELRRPSLSLAGRDLPADLTYPVDVEWRGWVRSLRKDPAPVTFTSGGSVRPTIRIGDLTVGAGPAMIPMGGHPLAASARLGGASDTVQLAWDGAVRGQMAEFPLGQAATWPGPPRVTVDWLTPDGARLLRRDYDGLIADNYFPLRRPVPGPSLVRWSGRLIVERAGPYELEVWTDGPARLFVDDRPLSTPRPGGTPDARRASIRLTAGEHPIVVERNWSEGGQIGLLWRYQDGPQQIVPPEAFAPIAWP